MYIHIVQICIYTYICTYVYVYVYVYIYTYVCMEFLLMLQRPQACLPSMVVSGL